MISYPSRNEQTHKTDTQKDRVIIFTIARQLEYPVSVKNNAQEISSNCVSSYVHRIYCMFVSFS